MFTEIPELLKWKVGYVSDPSIDILLDKTRIAQIKIRELDASIRNMETNLEIVRMTRDALSEQYKIK